MPLIRSKALKEKMAKQRDSLFAALEKLAEEYESRPNKPVKKQEYSFFTSKKQIEINKKKELQEKAKEFGKKLEDINAVTSNLESLNNFYISFKDDFNDRDKLLKKFEEKFPNFAKSRVWKGPKQSIFPSLANSVEPEKLKQQKPGVENMSTNFDGKNNKPRSRSESTDSIPSTGSDDDKSDYNSDDGFEEEVNNSKKTVDDLIKAIKSGKEESFNFSDHQLDDIRYDLKNLHDSKPKEFNLKIQEVEKAFNGLKKSYPDLKLQAEKLINGSVNKAINNFRTEGLTKISPIVTSSQAGEYNKIVQDQKNSRVRADLDKSLKDKHKLSDGDIKDVNSLRQNDELINSEKKRLKQVPKKAVQEQIAYGIKRKVIDNQEIKARMALREKNRLSKSNKNTDPDFLSEGQNQKLEKLTLNNINKLDNNRKIFVAESILSKKEGTEEDFKKYKEEIVKLKKENKNSDIENKKILKDLALTEKDLSSISFIKAAKDLNYIEKFRKQAAKDKRAAFYRKENEPGKLKVTTAIKDKFIDTGLQLQEAYENLPAFRRYVTQKSGEGARITGREVVGAALAAETIVQAPIKATADALYQLGVNVALVKVGGGIVSVLSSATGELAASALAGGARMSEAVEWAGRNLKEGGIAFYNKSWENLYKPLEDFKRGKTRDFENKRDKFFKEFKNDDRLQELKKDVNSLLVDIESNKEKIAILEVQKENILEKLRNSPKGSLLLNSKAELENNLKRRKLEDLLESKVKEITKLGEYYNNTLIPRDNLIKSKFTTDGGVRNTLFNDMKTQHEKYCTLKNEIIKYKEEAKIAYEDRKEQYELMDQGKDAKREAMAQRNEEIKDNFNSFGKKRAEVARALDKQAVDRFNDGIVNAKAKLSTAGQLMKGMGKEGREKDNAKLEAEILNHTKKIEYFKTNHIKNNGNFDTVENAEKYGKMQEILEGMNKKLDKQKPVREAMSKINEKRFEPALGDASSILQAAKSIMSSVGKLFSKGSGNGNTPGSSPDKSSKGSNKNI